MKNRGDWWNISSGNCTPSGTSWSRTINPESYFTENFSTSTWKHNLLRPFTSVHVEATVLSFAFQKHPECYFCTPWNLLIVVIELTRGLSNAACRSMFGHAGQREGQKWFRFPFFVPKMHRSRVFAFHSVYASFFTCSEWRACLGISFIAPKCILRWKLLESRRDISCPPAGKKEHSVLIALFPFWEFLLTTTTSTSSAVSFLDQGQGQLPLQICMVPVCFVAFTRDRFREK